MTVQADLFGPQGPECPYMTATRCDSQHGLRCGCGYIDEHVGPHHCKHCGHAWATAPAPPTGPPAEPYTREEGQSEKFLAWINTEAGHTAWIVLLTEAHKALDAGERFSVLGWIHEYRKAAKARVNNTWAPWLADELVGQYPDLEDTIERRERKKPRPTAVTP